MPSPTSLEVLLSDTEYSRYEVGRDTVIATTVSYTHLTLPTTSRV